MVVPAYCTSRQGKVFRVVRVSVFVTPDRVRYLLRAVPIRPDRLERTMEVAREMDATGILERLALRQTIATPEETFEQLWQQLRLDVDAPSP